MNESLPPPDVPHEAMTYQPMSLWAIGGLSISILFTLLVAVSTIVGMVQGAPVFFPLWIMVLAVVGFLFSWIGVRHVQNSEGTRAGARLAVAGMWLSLLSGLSYFSYYYFTGLALQNQANDFLMVMGEDSGFFPRLIEGAANPVQINAAFLLTIPATSRSGRPEDENNMALLHDAPGTDGSPGNLSTFRATLFTRSLYGDLASDAEITPLAVQEWRYEQRSYKVFRIYRVKTREADHEFWMAVFSTEPEAAGQGRKWFVNLKESRLVSKTLTPLGEGMKLLRRRALEALYQRMQALSAGEAWSDFEAMDQTNWNRLLKFYKEDYQPMIRKSLTRLFTAGEKNKFVFAPSPADDTAPWEMAAGKIRIHHQFRINLAPQSRDDPVASLTGDVVLESRQAIDPARYDQSSLPPEWQVIRVALTHAAPMTERK